MKKLNLRDRVITTDFDSFVMGIVNVTPDSFFDESRGGIERAKCLIDEGADILDLGAESTRPGSSYVSEEEEIKRIIPVIKEIRRFSNIPISIDTRKAKVFEECLKEGADILNDISALEDDENLVELCAKEKVPVILMHKRATPDVMQLNTEYEDIFNDVNDYLEKRVEYALKNGIKEDKIILDPGIGFGKSAEDNCTLIKKCGKLLDGKYPVLMALSRKSVIGALTGREVHERLVGTVTADIISVLAGASLIRVHDVKEAVDSLKVLKGLS